MKLLFLGSQGSQSTATLLAILDAGLRPGLILVHREESAANALTLPVLGARSGQGPSEIGARHGIAVSEVGRKQLGAAVVHFAPDLAVVSCYPYRVGDDLLSHVPFGWVNVHPSALPAYPGPTPIFWQLRDGARSVGVTLHRMTGALDGGPILDQSTIRLPEGALHSAISAMAGKAGGEMIGRLVRGGAGAIPPGRAQPASPGGWRGRPDRKAFQIDPEWSALRIFNFVRGVRELGAPLLSMADGRLLIIDEAVAWSRDAGSGPPVEARPEQIRLKCYDGIVTLTTRAEDQFR